MARTPGRGRLFCRERCLQTAGVQQSLKVLELRAHCRGSLVARLAILLECLEDDGFQLYRELRIPLRRRNWRAIQNGFGDDEGGVAGESAMTSNHFVEHQTEGEEIGARIEFFTADLFRRHE